VFARAAGATPAPAAGSLIWCQGKLQRSTKKFGRPREASLRSAGLEASAVPVQMVNFIIRGNPCWTIVNLRICSEFYSLLIATPTACLPVTACIQSRSAVCSPMSRLVAAKERRWQRLGGRRLLPCPPVVFDNLQVTPVAQLLETNTFQRDEANG